MDLLRDQRAWEAAAGAPALGNPILILLKGLSKGDADQILSNMFSSAAIP